MQEIEAKILEVDPNALENCLQSLGAKVSFDDEMRALFFDWPDGRITQAGAVLRLRKEGPTTVLTHKRALSRAEAKVMEETETEVADFAAMQQILEGSGLLVIKETHKFRRQYDLVDSHVVIDDYQGPLAHIPVFAEIEAPSVARLREIVVQLGYAPEQALSWSTYDLVQHYGVGSTD
jgi:predicted adenylyl cyclase CyaB